ncbi:hypothetical protein JD844_020368 [Phrynosoma platyrhinos]|uniref:Uncharacterized protein n=1 Tax=Phrynosoma platyrhinos TaxID=52577 RepID=A0ABQ7SS61_PHRPL|nr:hypothetical protein JD844_020368 [Phrynosoma platyrhinos]
MSPFVTDLPIPSSLDVSFSSHPDEIKDFSSVDLSFLPDDLDRDNKDDGGSMLEEPDGPQPGIQDGGTFLDGRNLSGPRDENSTQPLSDPSGSCLPMTPMTPRTPMTPTSESSGIVPQLQNIVATVNLACKLDLKNIALHARNAEYNPKRRTVSSGSPEIRSCGPKAWLPCKIPGLQNPEHGGQL